MIEILDLAHCKINDDGARVLIEALGHNVSIKNLRVYGNLFDPEYEMRLQYLVIVRNAFRIPVTVRRVSLGLIAARRIIANAGSLSVFPKEIVHGGVGDSQGSHLDRCGPRSHVLRSIRNHFWKSV